MDNNDVWIYHYGVKGMKWGVRHERKAAKQAYRNAKKKAAKDFYDVVDPIDKGSKGRAKYTDSERAKVNKASKDYDSAVGKAKSAYKSQIKQIKTNAKNAKKNRKDVDAVYRGIHASPELVSIAALSMMNKQQARKFSEQSKRGNMYVQAELKKNYTNRSIDINIGGQRVATVNVGKRDKKTGTYGYTMDFAKKNGAQIVDKYLKEFR